MNSTIARILAEIEDDLPVTLICESCFDDLNCGESFNAKSARNWQKVLNQGLSPKKSIFAINGNCEICNWQLANSFAYLMA